MDLRQPILLAIAILVPSVLLGMGRTRAVLGWVCLTLFVQVFDTTTVTNLQAGRIVGLLYLPLALLTARRWMSTSPVKTWLINFLYLAALGLAWGFIWPWPDITLNRPFTLTAPGRTIIYLGRMLSDFSLTLFVARELCRPGSLESLRKAAVVGASLTALFAMATVVFKIDFFQVITGLHGDFSDQARARGLSYEPRGLGLACAYGIILLIPYSRPNPTWALLLVTNLLGLLLAGSTSALALFMAGLVTIGMFAKTRERLLLLAVSAAGLGCLLVAGSLMSSKLDAVIDIVMYRLDPTEKLGGVRAENWGERIAYHLDVFDASALLFLTREPLYFLSGAGPGLVSLPASYHVPPGIYSAIWTEDIGVDSLPTHGLLLEAANSGLLGLGLWLGQMFACWRAIAVLAARPVPAGQTNPWKLGRVMFCVGVMFYLVQVSISPAWPVLLGIGWAACFQVHSKHTSTGEATFTVPRLHIRRAPRLAIQPTV